MARVSPHPSRVTGASQASGASIVADLRPLVGPIEDLQPDPQNLNTHDRRSLEQLKVSLTRYGQRKPVVATRVAPEAGPPYTVIAGNGLHAAALELGWTELARVLVDSAGQLDREYAIVDNRSAFLARFDYARLVEELGQLMVLGTPTPTLGFTAAEYEAMTVYFQRRARGPQAPVQFVAPADLTLPFRVDLHPPELMLVNQVLDRVKRLTGLQDTASVLVAVFRWLQDLGDGVLPQAEPPHD